MFPRTISATTLVRSDSGIDIVSEDGITINSYRDGATQVASPSVPSLPETEEEEANEPQTWKEKICPPRGPIVKWFTWLCVLLFGYFALWSLLPEKMQPDKSMFGLVVTILLCIAAEQLVVKIPTPRGYPPLPPLLASLLMGLALRNLPPPCNIASYIKPEVSGVFRELALTVILTRAGLEIDPDAMKKVKWAVVRLAFMPCIAETCLIGIFGNVIMGFSFEWSFMMGFMIAAVSPAVVIPSLIILQDVGFGVAKGVPSLVMAASGIDDVLAIAGFTVLLGIAIPSGLEDDIISVFTSLSQDDTTLSLSVTPSAPTPMDNSTYFNDNSTDFNVTSSPNQPVPINIGKEVGGAIIEIIIGVISGLIFGFFISYVPSRTMRFKSFCRGFLLLSIGILYVFGSAVWGIPGAGALCALIMSFTASLHWKEETKPLEVAWHYMWVIFQPILFGLTGTLVEVDMMDGETVGLGLAVLGIAICGRLCTSTLVTFGQKLNWKEKFFISIAWIPKGTVQAALGSAAMEMAIQQHQPQEKIYWGQQILVLAVLITLITAPIGAFGISIAGPKLLSTNIGIEPNPQDNEAYDDTESHTSERCESRRGSWERGCHFAGLELKIKDPTLGGIQEEEDDEAYSDSDDSAKSDSNGTTSFDSRL